MNTIQCILFKSDEQNLDYLNFLIDGCWLDEKLDLLYPGNQYKGLIPTLSYWLSIQNERKVVWKRILPLESECTICPILMCPDDLDFSCTLVVAEIQNHGSHIQWKRLGIDMTSEWEAEKVGSMVRWFEDFPELSFDRNDYTKMVENFKQQYEIDKNGI